MAAMLEVWQVSALNTLSMFILVTAAVIALTKSIQLAVKTYIVQACLLALIFLVIGAKYEWFIGWSLSAIITKAIIVPSILFWVIRRTRYVVEREEPLLSPGSYALLVAAVYAVSLVLARHIALAAHIGAAAPLTASMALIMVGLSILTLSRNALKQLMGIILFENGSHILLASMAFYVPETVEIGIATDAVILIAILAYLAHMMAKIKGDMDVSKLTTLKY